MMRITVLILAIVGMSACASKPVETDSQIDPYLSIFTTELDENDFPVDDVKEVSITEDGKVILYTKWNMPDGDYRILTIIMDGDGRVLRKSPYSFTVTGQDHNTWHTRNFRPQFDVPGRWTFEVVLDEETVIERELQVRP